jgi:hypothetical protein
MAGQDLEGDKSEMRGSLHCAADDETVRRFGRDDVFFSFVEMTFSFLFS